MTRLTLTVLAACWALALVGEVAQTPAPMRRADQMVQETA